MNRNNETWEYEFLAVHKAGEKDVKKLWLTPIVLGLLKAEGEWQFVRTGKKRLVKEEGR